MKKKTSFGRAVLILFAIVLAAVTALLYYDSMKSIEEPAPPPPEPIESSEPPSEPEVEEYVPPENLHKEQYTVHGLGPDEERLDYTSGSLILKVPRLDYIGSVLEAMPPAMKEHPEQRLPMDESVMNAGIALFSEAQLPGVENRNVSIAGHRDIFNMEFFYIDTLQEGDLMYLYYDGKEYTYEYVDTVITHPRDWSYIETSEYSTLTLQSCDPVYVATDRIFAYGHLLDVRELSTEEIKELQKEFPAFSDVSTYVPKEPKEYIELPVRNNGQGKTTNPEE